MKDFIMGIIGMILFVVEVGIIGGCEMDQITIGQCAVRSLIVLALFGISVLIYYAEDIWEAVKHEWRMKKRSRIKSKRF